jgi:hypothetical protein
MAMRAAALALLLGGSVSSQRVKRPNIVFIMVRAPPPSS